MFKKIKQQLLNIYTFLMYPVFYLRWLFYSFKNDNINIIVGAGKFKYDGWFSTEEHFLDLTSEKNFEKLFRKKKIDKILAEHVLEHLTSEHLDLMLQNLFKYSSENVNIRIAVPDGFHSDKEYIENVKPNGKGDGAFDHKHLFNYKSLGSLFEQKGFKSNPIEYWDENQKFNTTYKNNENGIIRRSFINDDRNKDGIPRFTSLIIDFTK